MTVYFQHVGESGGRRDFPKTIGTMEDGVVEFRFSDIAGHLSNFSNEEKDALEQQLTQLSPTGFQIWGIPSGAKSVLRNLKIHDSLLLLESAGYGGSFAYGGKIVAFPSKECFELSQHLWGEAKFPLIVFMKGKMANFLWRDFCNLVNYKANWNPAGQTYRITEDKMNFGGFQDDNQLLDRVIGLRSVEDEKSTIPMSDEFFDPVEELFTTTEGRQVLRTHLERERSVALVRKFKRNLSTFECMVCGFDFEKVYGRLGRDFIEAHHIVPISLLRGEVKVKVNDLVPLCSNCHRMIHRESPMLTPDQLKKKLAEALEKRSMEI